MGWILVLVILFAVFLATALWAQTAPTFPFSASTINTTVPNTIKLKSQGYDEETTSSFTGTFYPGSLLALQSDGSVQPHAVYGGTAEKIIAREDAYQGHSIIDAYSQNDVVFYTVCVPGDQMQLLLAPGSKCTESQELISNGDGQVTTSPSVGGLGTAIYANVADSTAVANTTTETVFNKNITLPANSLQAGDVIKVRALVDAIGVTSTPTLNIKLNFLSGTSATTVNVMATGAVTQAASNLVEVTATIIIRTVGATGTFVAEGMFTSGVPGTAVPTVWSKGSTTLDTTQTEQVNVSATWSAASSSNTCLLRELVVELTRTLSPIAVALQTIDNSAGTTYALLQARMK